MNLNPTTVCLGYTGIVNGRLIYHLINIIKTHIYVTKCKEGQICIKPVMLQIRKRNLIENIVEFKHVMLSFLMINGIPFEFMSVNVVYSSLFIPS